MNLRLDSPGRKSFFLEVDAKARVGLYAQHTAEEFDLQLTNAQGATVGLVVERTWVAQHEHDDEVGSIAIERTATSIPKGSTPGSASCSVSAGWISSE